MRQIRILSLPRLQFAHSFEAERYENRFGCENDRIEISVLIKGSMQIISDTAEYAVSQGDVSCATCRQPVLIRADSFHCHHTVSAQVEWEEVGSGGLYIPDVITADMHTEELTRLIDGFVYGFDSLSSNPTRAAAKFLELLCRIDETVRRHGLFDTAGAALYTERAKRFIGLHISEPILQSDVAAHLGISSGYLCAVFKETEGMTLMQYINRQKLEGIKRVMQRERVTLQKAASLYGFSDPNYVSRLHKKLFGYNVTDRPIEAKIQE